MHPARTFLADAHAHAKFIGVSEGAQALLERVGVTTDDGMKPLKSAADAKAFINACASLRFWERLAK